MAVCFILQNLPCSSSWLVHIASVTLISLCFIAILVYRVFGSGTRKSLLKILHMVMQLSAFGFSVFGLKAVFSAHNDEGFANLYSLHSWVGLSTIIMFAMQVSFYDVK